MELSPRSSHNFMFRVHPLGTTLSLMYRILLTHTKRNGTCAMVDHEHHFHPVCTMLSLLSWLRVSGRDQSCAELADKPEATIPHDVAKRACVEIRRI